MARRKQNAINIEADMSDGYLALGFVTGLATEVSTDRFIAPVIEYAHNEMAKSFDQEMDMAATANPEAYSHVYEWRITGSPQGRLWRHTLSGRGANRQASWEWVKSATNILTPEERKEEDNPNDPITGVDDDDLEKLSGRDYVFFWKAPIMEYGLKVTITPKYASNLFIPTFSAERGFVFAKYSNNQMRNVNVGRFTAFWTNWWSSGADDTWNSTVKDIIERDLGRSEKEIGRAGGRKRKKSFSISTIADNEKAFEAGRNYAEAYVKGRAKNYKQASKYIDRYGKYGDEVNY